MINVRRLGSWILAVLVLVLFLATIINAFAAGNTMPANPSAGDGSNTISGFTISNIHYQLDANDPTYLSDTNSVQFTIAPAISSSGSVKIQLTHAGVNSWQNCSVSGGVNVTCSVPASAITVSGITNLRVVAAQ